MRRKKKKYNGIRNAKARRSHKDALFCRIFSEKEYALSLYNAVHDTSYTDIDSLTVVTLEDVLYISMKNDVAICFHEYMDLYEHQSTINLNMPLRGFLYYAKEISGWLYGRETEIYSPVLIRIPAPQHYVFYNGIREFPERYVWRLSDAFEVPVEGYEWTSYVININPPHNRELMERCRVLGDYSAFISLIRECSAGGRDLTAAVSMAVDECINRDILADYLRKHKGEVMGFMTEYNEEHFKRIMMDYGRSEGLKEGMAKGIAEGTAKGLAEGLVNGRSQGGFIMLYNLVSKDILSVSVAASQVGQSEEVFLDGMNRYLSTGECSQP